MESYTYKPDKKLHTRFSELVKCTPAQVKQVAYEKIYNIHNSNPYTEFGTKRHIAFANYLLENKKLPDKFNLNLEIDPENVECSYDIEMFENVIIHLTPDVHDDNWVADFKTTGKGAVNYKNDKQVKFYAWVLNTMGHNITKGYYLCELWDKDRTKKLGYERLDLKITKDDIRKVKEWAKPRIALLYKTLKEEYATKK